MLIGVLPTLYAIKWTFTESEGPKIRPVLVLFEELDNVVITGITTNLNMKGIPITVK